MVTSGFIKTRSMVRIIARKDTFLNCVSEIIHNCINFSSLSSTIYQENMSQLLNEDDSKVKPVLLDLLLSFPYTVYFRKFTGIILRSC